MSCRPATKEETIEHLLQENKSLIERIYALDKELKQALTPPTEEEMCEALSEELGEKIIYIGFNFTNIIRTKIAVQLNLKNKNIKIFTELSPHLITMIVRFYEGVMNDERY